MDELEIKGKKYISSKRASELTGYAKDYIGQLARAGKIIGTRMGRAWYVEEASLMLHAKSDMEGSQLISPIQRAAPRVSRQFMSGAVSFPTSWAPATYSSDDSDLMLRPIKDVVSSTHVLVEPPLEHPVTLEGVPEELETSIRIKILEERSQPQTQIYRTAIPKTEFRIAEKANNINKKRKSKNNALAFGALGAALVVFAFFSSGFFLSSNIEFAGPEKVYTANVLAGWQYFQDVSAQLPVFTQGLHSLQNFFTTLLSSSSDFFSKGASFLSSIFQQSK